MATLTDAADFLSGGTPRKSNAAFWDGDIPWFSASNMGRRFLSKSDMMISEAGLQAGSKMAPKGATLLLVRGSGLFNYIPICFADREVAFNQDVKAIVAKNGVDPTFLHFCIESHRTELGNNLDVTGIGAGKFDTGFLKSLPFPDISFEEQTKIGIYAESIDRKIELNRQMNEVLEGMARAVFRDWFVDFGPTRRKMAGEGDPVKILGGAIVNHPQAQKTAALFPDRLGKNGLPEGWEEKPLDEIADFLNGLALQKYPAKDGEDSLPVLKIAELRNGITAKTHRASREVPEKFVIQNKDFIFSWSGSLLAKFWTGGECALNQHLFKVTSHVYPAWYFGAWVNYHLAEFQRIAAGKAVTMGHIKRSHLKEAMTFCPSLDAIKVFGQTIEPLIEKTLQNSLENQTLAEMRDLLLPKLMSGEIRLREGGDV